MEIDQIEEHFVPFSHIREALERAGMVGNLTLMFNGDPAAPRGYQFKPRGWRVFRRSEADAYINLKRERLGLPPVKEGAK
jgi:hypothetical protein